MRLTTEAHVKKAIKKILDSFDVFYHMPAASIYGKRGIPDFICSAKGVFVGIEAKSPTRGKKGLSAMQAIVKQQVIKSEGYYFIVYNEKTLDKLKNNLCLIIDEVKNDCM